MNRRLMFAALWFGVVIACCAGGLFLFTQLGQPDCDAALLIAASDVPSTAARSAGQAAAALSDCKETESLYLSLDDVAVALGAGASVLLAVALFLRLRSAAAERGPLTERD